MFAGFLSVSPTVLIKSFKVLRFHYLEGNLIIAEYLNAHFFLSSYLSMRYKTV